MKVLIIEDEKLAADHLSSLIHRYDAAIEIIDRLNSIEKSVAWFSDHPQPDLAFFDIQLADGISFEIFEQVDISCPVIFTTAFNEYALKAFKVNSIDYLLKPIDFDELKGALDKYHRNHDQKTNSGYQFIAENVLNMLTDKYKQRFVIKVGEHIRSIPITNILYFYSLEKATFLTTADNHNYVIDYSLDQIEQLVDPSKFFKINRKYIISMEAVQDIIAYSNSRLKIELVHTNDMDAIVARERVVNFKRWLDR